MTRPGLTLIELVVVLAILATLALVAVVSTEGVVEQGRFDVTQRTLQNIDDAVLGPEGKPDAVCFVSDIGSRPKLLDTNPETQLRELWQNPADFPLRPYSPIAPASNQDPEIKLNSGWRGPYLRLPNGQTTLMDGWTRPFSFQADGGGFLMQASNSFADLTPPYNQPLTLMRNHPMDSLGEVRGMLTVAWPSSSAPPTNATVQLKLWVPDGRNLLSGVSEPTPVQYTEFHSTTTVGANTLYTSSFAFTGVPAAPVALRAYKDAAAITDTNASNRNNKSTIQYFRVPPRGSVIRDVYLNP